MASSALAFHEPDIVTILIQASFLLVSNVLGFVLDYVLYCGLVGQVLVGVAWGTPGAKLLPRRFEEAVTQLGYLGLILIVFEGGLATSAKSVKGSLLLSVCVAFTGIAVPMVLSFSLIGISHATKLQAFAAGAALCSTSLGTTFSLLKTTGLTTSRLGAVLTSAAMLDDVVGLILVQVISNLGSGRSSISATEVVRPVFVSLTFAIAVPVVCKFLSRPLIPKFCTLLNYGRLKHWSNKPMFSLPLSFLLSTAVLVGMVTGATYAGTSNLFAAYLAGACLSWLDEVLFAKEKASEQEGIRLRATKNTVNTRATTSTPFQYPKVTAALTDDETRETQSPSLQPPQPSHELTPPPETMATKDPASQGNKSITAPAIFDTENFPLRMYTSYYAPTVDRILKPFFFASIGFSIPISKMFRGPVLWRGIVYAILMAFGKLCCGLWLVRFNRPPSPTLLPPPQIDQAAPPPASNPPIRKYRKGKQPPKQPPLRKNLPRSKSLYPASILGCAMIARGEIGFLIATLAASNGVFSRHDDSATSTNTDDDDDELTSELYLVVTWAILLCTIVGPLTLGILARRVKRLQAKRAGDGGDGNKEDPLGEWGIT